MFWWADMHGSIMMADSELECDPYPYPDREFPFTRQGYPNRWREVCAPLGGHKENDKLLNGVFGSSYGCLPGAKQFIRSQRSKHAEPCVGVGL